MKKIILISAIITAAMSSSAMAQNTITFNGVVKETTCAITTSAGAADFAVNLPIISSAGLTVDGNIVESKQSFTITAQGASCADSKIYLSTGDIGEAPGLLYAKHKTEDDQIFIKVENAAGESVLFNDYAGLAPTTTDVPSETATYDFNAYYYGDLTGAMAGEYVATATYIVTHL